MFFLLLRTFHAKCNFLLCLSLKSNGMSHYKFIFLKSTLLDSSVFKSSYALSIHLSVLKLALIPKVLIISFPVKDVAAIS